MHRATYSVLSILLVSVIFFSCQTPQTNVSDVRKIIEEANAVQIKSFETKDVQNMTTNYAEDAVVCPQNGPMVTGKENIAAFFNEMLSMMKEMSFASTKFDASGDIAYEVGTYSGVWDMPGMGAVDDKGKYVSVWKKQADGTWKIVVDIFNTDMPMSSEVAME
jgi:ketosteroid isomerase-like protein